MTNDLPFPDDADLHSNHRCHVIILSINDLLDVETLSLSSHRGHFTVTITLLDVESRGFVRHLCISYFAWSANKISQILPVVRDAFLEVSARLKQGNALRLSFMVGLEADSRLLPTVGLGTDSRLSPMVGLETDSRGLETDCRSSPVAGLETDSDAMACSTSSEAPSLPMIAKAILESEVKKNVR